MENSTVYVLTRESRFSQNPELASDFHVCGVFKTREDAKRFADGLLTMFSEAVEEKRTFGYSELKDDEKQGYKQFVYEQNEKDVLPCFRFECVKEKLLSYTNE